MKFGVKKDGVQITLFAHFWIKNTILQLHVSWKHQKITPNCQDSLNLHTWHHFFLYPKTNATNQIIEQVLLFSTSITIQVQNLQKSHLCKSRSGPNTETSTTCQNGAAIVPRLPKTKKKTHPGPAHWHQLSIRPETKENKSQQKRGPLPKRAGKKKHTPEYREYGRDSLG